MELAIPTTTHRQGVGDPARETPGGSKSGISARISSAAARRKSLDEHDVPAPVVQERGQILSAPSSTPSQPAVRAERAEHVGPVNHLRSSPPARGIGPSLSP